MEGGKGKGFAIGFFFMILVAVVDHSYRRSTDSHTHGKVSSWRLELSVHMILVLVILNVKMEFGLIP